LNEPVAFDTKAFSEEGCPSQHVYEREDSVLKSVSRVSAGDDSRLDQLDHPPMLIPGSIQPVIGPGKAGTLDLHRRHERRIRGGAIHAGAWDRLSRLR